MWVTQSPTRPWSGGSGSYYLIGAQLGRFGHSRVALPGGCNFAPRPIDQHVKGFLALGAEVEETDAYVDAYAREGGLRGGRVNLDVVSVGATINIMIASVLVPGQTVIENAAKEPHIVDLPTFEYHGRQNLRSGHRRD